MSGIFSQLGVVKEVTYGTPVVVTRFFEMVSESIAEEYARVESASLRDSQRVLRADRWAPNFKGASGTVELEVMSKGFGFWLEHMLGTVTTSGPAETTAYTHVGKIGSLTGKAFTCQVGRPDTSGTVRAFTYEGGKITGWELSNSVDGVLIARLDTDFENVLTATALATDSYPTAMEVLTFVGGSVSIGGSALSVTDFTLRANNNLKTDRYFVRANTQKKEPLENGMREYTVSCTVEFEDMTQYNRVASATVAGAQADILAKWEGSLAGATTLKNTLQVDLDTVRWDSFTPQVSGPELLTATLEGKVVDDGGADGPVKLTYITRDVTP